MESIVSNITSGFLNDILKATATSGEVSEYQNIILPGLLSAVAKYCEFKDKILERLRVPRSQPTIKEAFVKCERDEIAKKLSEQEVILKDCVRMNQKFMQDVDYFMKIKMVDNVPKVVECISPLQSAHQKARERHDAEVAVETPKVSEETPNIQITITEDEVKISEVLADAESTGAIVDVAADQAPDGEETKPTGAIVDVAADQAPNGEETEPTGADTDVVDETVEKVVEETEPTGADSDVVEEIEAEEVETEEVAETEPMGEESKEVAEEVDAEQAPDGEEDVSEEEIDVEEVEEDEEEVEEYSYKGKKYYVTNTTNGKIYACTADDDIGDQVGTFKNGKPIFS